MRLYLVRHAQPEIAPGICYGSTDLTVSDRNHARALPVLAATLPRGVPVFSSPLRRCRELAGVLAAMLGAVGVTHDARLAEMHFGAWEMRSWEKIPRSEIDAWAGDLTVYRPGGGENVMEVARRVQSFYQSLLEQKTESAVVVCHAGTIRLLLACRRDVPLEEAALHAARNRHNIAYGEMIVLDC